MKIPFFNRKKEPGYYRDPVDDTEANKILDDMVGDLTDHLSSFGNSEPYLQSPPNLLVFSSYCRTEDKKRCTALVTFGEFTEKDASMFFMGAKVQKQESESNVKEVKVVALAAEAKITVVNDQKKKRGKKADPFQLPTILQTDSIAVVLRTDEGRTAFASIPFRRNNDGILTDFGPAEIRYLAEVDKMSAEKDDLLEKFFEGYEFAKNHTMEQVNKKLGGVGIVVKLQDDK